MQIYYFYISAGPIRDEARGLHGGGFARGFALATDAPAYRGGTASSAACRLELRSRVECAAARQFVEFGEIVTDTIRARDNDLPAFVGEGPCPGDGGGDG
jgi:hypothetical protein